MDISELNRARDVAQLGLDSPTEFMRIDVRYKRAVEMYECGLYSKAESIDYIKNGLTLTGKGN